jgi:hemerythrin-like domain-containing protein
MSDTRLISRSPVNLLMDEHQLLGSLLEAYEGLAPEQMMEKARLTRKIDDEVGRHIGTEESLFYPTLLELKDSRVHERVAEALAEHRVLEALAENLRKAGPGAARDSAVRTLHSHVSRHLDFEEQEVFPFSWGLPGITLNQMGLEIEERRTREGYF